MAFLYIDHVVTCICLRGLEKKGFKMWRDIQKKNANNVTVLVIQWKTKLEKKSIKKS